MKSFKVLFVTHYSGLYGANKSLLNLIDGLLLKSGVEIEVLCLTSGDLVPELKSRGVRTHFSCYHLNVVDENDERKQCLSKACKNIISAIKFWKRSGYSSYDVIYTNSSLLNFGFLLSFLFRAKHVYHLREFGELDYRLKRCCPWLFQLCLKLSSLVICISDSIKNYYGVDKGIVIYNGVTTKLTLKKRTSKDTVRIGMVGVLRDEKGFYEAISSILFCKPNGKKIEINHFGNGDEDYKDKCHKLVTQASDVKFIFYGFVKETSEIYSTFDILIVPSYFEALGRVTQEAMCFGIPVIGRNSGGTKELIEPGVNGFLFKDEKEIASMLEEIDNNYELFSQNALRTATNFLQQYYSEKIYSLLKVLVQ